MKMNPNKVFLGIIAAICITTGVLIGSAFPVASNYNRSLANVLVSEGGSRYTNHPSDPGGPTKYGVTIHDVRRYLKPGATAADVKRLTEVQARQIYRKHYADVIDFDLLPAGLDYALLDYSINAGYSRALGDFYRTLGLPRGRGEPSRADILKLAARPTTALIADFNARRLKFQLGLGSRYNVFKKGWRNRIQSVDRLAQGMAGGRVAKRGYFADIPTLPGVGPGKAYDQEEIDVLTREP